MTRYLVIGAGLAAQFGLNGIPWSAALQAADGGSQAMAPASLPATE